MAQYIMEKLSDSMLGDGEKLFPRLVNGQVMDQDYIAKKMEERTSFTRGDVIGMLSELAAIVEEAMAGGNSVKIGGLGLFRPVLGLVGKELRGEWKDTANRTTTGRNVQLKTVNFRPDKDFLYNVSNKMTLERANNQMGRKQPATSLSDRAAMARKYLEEHSFMRVADYVSLTGLARSTATLELRRLAQDEQSGIVTSGQGSSKVYKRRGDN